MKKFSSALALAAAMALPAAAQAAKHEMNGPSVDFGLDMEINGYMVDMDTDAEDANGNETDQFNGFQQRTLFTANMKGEGGVSFHSGLLLTGDTWSGDNHTNASAGTLPNGQSDAAGRTGVTDQGDGSDVVTLDHAYVQVPMLGGVVRAGRMKASWANCFLACDDRRDRIQYLTRVGNTTVFGLFDKRQEGDINISEDDGNMWLAGFIGNYSGWTAGSLFIYFEGDDAAEGPTPAAGDDSGIGPYSLTDIVLISPYVKGKVGPVSLEGGLNYFDGGSEDANALFQDAGTSEFIRAGFDAGPVLIEGQVIAVQGGGLVDDGFDTFSSLIGNSPSRDVSPTQVASIGHFGVANATDELEQQMYALRVSGNITDQWKLMGAVGGFNYDNSSTNVDFDGSGTFFDAQVHYMVNKATTISATYGQLSGDDIQAGMTAFNAGAGEFQAARDDADPSAMSLNLNVKF